VYAAIEFIEAAASGSPLNVSLHQRPPPVC
jgi:hypothetical protein